MSGHCAICGEAGGCDCSSEGELRTHYLAYEIEKLRSFLDRLEGIRTYVGNIETENALLRDEVARLNKEREDQGRVPAFEIAAKAIRDSFGRGEEDWRQFIPAAFAALLHAPAQGIEAGTDETPKEAQPEGREPDREAMRP
jgi:hypothetical protein